jgi:hypothetical protein
LFQYVNLPNINEQNTSFRAIHSALLTLAELHAEEKALQFDHYASGTVTETEALKFNYTLLQTFRNTMKKLK